MQGLSSGNTHQHGGHEQAPRDGDPGAQAHEDEVAGAQDDEAAQREVAILPVAHFGLWREAAQAKDVADGVVRIRQESRGQVVVLACNQAFTSLARAGGLTI